VEIPDGRDPRYYIDAINSDIDLKYTRFAVVILQRKEHKKGIKATLDKMGLPS
jgi:hypothetical protein